MEARRKLQKHKLLLTVVAVVAAAAILLTGTFAWQSIEQTAMNKTKGFANPGGRLHDDFNGENKDIYVENFTSEEDNGVPIYARVRLEEYMELGPGAGETDGERTGIQVVGKEDAQLGDTDTWLIHKMEPALGEEDTTTAETQIHDYWSWDMGGKTTYMPTFNKNKDSLEADINGTYEGTDPEDNVHYDNYHEYTADEEKTENAVYDADSDTTDEGETAQEGTDITTIEETHTAAETLESQVLTMEEWKAMGSPVGEYWVYDVDGWAYWAQAIEPGQATGLLLDGIQLNRQPDDEWYYAINAVGQFATAGDWGDEGTQSGFYEDGITKDALFLLNQAAGRLPRVESVTIEGGHQQYVKAGETLELTANVILQYPTGDASETYVVWSSSPNTAALNGNRFTASTNMVGRTYRLTATSAFDSSKSTYVDVYVYPADAQGVVAGELDGKTYVSYPDNTYREIQEDGSLKDFVCAGLDEIIGNYDDKAQVVVLEEADVSFGSKFLGPNEGDTYWAMGPDGKLGTADDIKVIGDPWPTNITNVLADKIEITAAGNADTVKIGKRLQFSAEVTRKGEPIFNQDVTWSVSGNTSESTKIDENGLLVVGADETVGGALIISAESKEMTGLSTNLSITVNPLDYNDLDSITPGSTQTVTIDGSEWFVLAKQDNKALIFSKSSLTPLSFGTSQNWSSSSLRTYLNETWLNGEPTLQEHVVPTDIYTRKATNSEEWDTTTDNVFILSEADVYGTIFVGREAADAKDYTLGRTSIILPEEIREIVGFNWWLRSPGRSTSTIAYVRQGGVSDASAGSETRGGIMPALWVELP